MYDSSLQLSCFGSIYKQSAYMKGRKTAKSRFLLKSFQFLTPSMCINFIHTAIFACRISRRSGEIDLSGFIRKFSWSF